MTELTLQQLMATSALILTLESICSRGILPLEEEIETRRLIVRAGNAFQLDALCERPSNIIDLETAVENLVRKEMSATP